MRLLRPTTRGRGDDHFGSPDDVARRERRREVADVSLETPDLCAQIVDVGRACFVARREAGNRRRPPTVLGGATSEETCGLAALDEYLSRALAHLRRSLAGRAAQVANHARLFDDGAQLLVRDRTIAVHHTSVILGTAHRNWPEEKFLQLGSSYAAVTVRCRPACSPQRRAWSLCWPARSMLPHWSSRVASISCTIAICSNTAA